MHRSKSPSLNHFVGERLHRVGPGSCTATKIDNDGPFRLLAKLM
jgi:hypothetical protein